MRQSPRAGKLLLLLAQLRPDCGSIGQWWGGPCVPHCTILYHVLRHCTTHCNWLLPLHCGGGSIAASAVRQQHMYVCMVCGVPGSPVPRSTPHLPSPLNMLNTCVHTVLVFHALCRTASRSIFLASDSYLLNHQRNGRRYSDFTVRTLQMKFDVDIL